MSEPKRIRCGRCLMGMRIGVSSKASDWRCPDCGVGLQQGYTGPRTGTARVYVSQENAAHIPPVTDRIRNMCRAYYPEGA